MASALPLRHIIDYEFQSECEFPCENTGIFECEKIKHQKVPDHIVHDEFLISYFLLS